MLKKTKIICTIGPSSKSHKILENLISGGMDVARINTSHSSQVEIIELVSTIRSIAERNNKNTAILLDLQGPKIRVGQLDKPVKLKNKQKIIFTTEENLNNFKNIYESKIDIEKNIDIVTVDYENFLNDIKEGATIFLDDGLLECKVLNINKDNKYAEALVIRGGTLKSHKGINLPGVSVSIDSVTKKDLEFLELGINEKVDFIAQSFVRQAGDVKQIKDIIRSKNSHIMVIAKIEKHEAVTNFNSILKQADGIMIARGDLGVEINQEDIPYIQKEIIKKTNIAGKPVITATQMLDSMIRNPRPTRAEVSDVANAILDGSDAVMLSGETASGKFPLEAFEMMVKIINKTESTLDYQEILQKKFAEKQNTITEAISFAACEIANELGCKAIITSTQSGNTARQISKNKPKSIIIGTSPQDWVIKQLMLSWGVIPVKTNFTNNINELIEEAVNVTKEKNLIKKGDTVVITGGVMINEPGSTNFINVKEI
ncbi:MAG: pyruvate kinase [Actinobacteria bacterium]|nr:pyruvate kinase [Cyanobacteriota bacterium]MCL5772484.1 pyruvate kinase [Actinomycetota bacterium]